MGSDALTFEQIIYIEFEGKTIGKILEVRPGYYDIRWEDDHPFPTPEVFCSVEDAKARVRKHFKNHL